MELNKVWKSDNAEVANESHAGASQLRPPVTPGQALMQLEHSTHGRWAGPTGAAPDHAATKSAVSPGDCCQLGCSSACRCSGCRRLGPRSILPAALASAPSCCFTAGPISLHQRDHRLDGHTKRLGIGTALLARAAAHQKWRQDRWWVCFSVH